MGETSSLRREIASAYLASGAKILSWVVVAGIVYRVSGSIQFGVLSLIRGTIGILNYVSLGVGPAMVKMMAGVEGRLDVAVARPLAESSVLSYYKHDPPSQLRRLYSSAVNFAYVSAGVGLALTLMYGFFFDQLHQIELGPRDVNSAVCFFGLGLLIRLISEPSAAVLQTNGRIAKDNQFTVEAEIAWIALTSVLILNQNVRGSSVYLSSAAYAAASMWIFCRRFLAAVKIAGHPFWEFDIPIVKRILQLGGLITLAQLADFLYAPTDYILINHFLGAEQVAAYAPAVQIDAGLLVLVSGMAAVLFPRSAIAHAAGDVAAVRKYYLRGTAWSAGILIVAGALMWLVSPIFLRAWFGNSMMATRAILPLVLIHTVIGGSAMVGRSVLLAAGKFGVFAGSVLIAGVVNVGVSYVLVRMGWGLKGIIIGTIVAVVLRCVVWMPWYVMRALREVKEIAVEAVAVPEL